MAQLVVKNCYYYYFRPPDDLSFAIWYFQKSVDTRSGISL